MTAAAAVTDLSTARRLAEALDANERLRADLDEALHALGAARGRMEMLLQELRTEREAFARARKDWQHELDQLAYEVRLVQAPRPTPKPEPTVPAAADLRVSLLNYARGRHTVHRLPAYYRTPENLAACALGAARDLDQLGGLAAAW